MTDTKVRVQRLNTMQTSEIVGDGRGNNTKKNAENSD